MVLANKTKMVERKDLKLNETLAMETCVLCVSVKRKKGSDGS